jgi:oligopeptide transport system permease protein
MARYVVHRTLWLGAVLFFVALITFTLMHAVPGGPWDQEKTLAPAVIENLNRRYSLDEPLWQQFTDYIWRSLRGDLGVSYIYQDRPVAEIIMDGLPKTAVLGLIALAFAIPVGLGLGIAAAVRRNSPLDYVSVLFATVGASIPNFVLGILLVIVFAVKLGWLPTGGWGSPKEAILPAFTLGLLPAAYLARVTRASMLEVLRQDYVRLAWAKGLPERVVVIRHAARNALIPVLTVLGPVTVSLVTGSFIVETVFSIPGIGRLFVQAVFQRDYGLIMGTVLFYGFVVAVANFVVDILYAAIDPRIRYN